jgi:TonB family protein
MAVGIASVDRFVPGTKDGVPVAVAQQLEIKLTLCMVNITDENGQSSERLRLKSPPVQKMFPSPKKLQPTTQLSTGSSVQNYGKPISGQTGGGVSAPVPLITPEPEYPIEQRKARVGGICLISLIVDADGIPQNLRVVRGINEVLNEKALETVAKFRFKPAMKGKQPIPIMMSIEINFRL